MLEKKEWLGELEKSLKVSKEKFKTDSCRANKIRYSVLKWQVSKAKAENTRFFGKILGKKVYYQIKFYFAWQDYVKLFEYEK